LEGAAEMDRRVFGIAAGIFAPGLGDPARRIEQAFPIGVVARPADQRPHGLADVARDFTRRRGFDEVAVLRVAMLRHCPISRAMSSATAAACSRMSGTAMISQ